MLQFYFLTIVLNALGGYILISSDEEAVLEFKSNFANGFTLKDETFKLVVGILSAVMGLLKILSPIEGDIPIIGDLLIAISSFAVGFILIFENYRNRASAEDTENSEKMSRLLVRNKKIVGIISLVLAALHFIFPRVLLL